MRRRPTLATTTAVLLLLLAAALAARPQQPERRRDDAAERGRVHVAVVRELGSDRVVTLSGVTRASRRAALAFAVPGRLASRPVSVGDRVAAGTLLAALDDREFRHADLAAAAALAETEARLAQMERDLARVARLAERKAATVEEREQMETATAALRAARDAAAAQRDDARRLLGEASLRATYAGTVTAVHGEPGEWMQPGRPVVEIAGDGGLEVEVEIPESLRGAIAVGAPVPVDLPLSGAHAAGRVTSLAAGAPGPGRLFAAVVTLEADSSLAAGLAAEVRVPVHGEPAAAVPLSAVLNPGASRPGLFRVRDGHVEAVAVELGALVGDAVIVRGAIAAGDTVVVAGHGALVDGDAILIAAFADAQGDSAEVAR